MRSRQEDSEFFPVISSAISSLKNPQRHDYPYSSCEAVTTKARQLLDKLMEVREPGPLDPDFDAPKKHPLGPLDPGFEDEPESEPEDPEKAMETALANILMDVNEFRSVDTFEDAGLMTHNHGLVIRTRDGNRFQLTIVQSRR